VEFQSALLKFKESERQVGAAQKNMEFANENLDIVTFTYNEGKGSMVDVLTSQLSWIQARNNLIQANTANKVAIAAYRKAVSE
jgi:outer membrane protein TolC